MTPWWCRTFGHSFVRTPITEFHWQRSTGVECHTYCRRCGTTPAPQAGHCTASYTLPSLARWFCNLQHGHAGSHHDGAIGVDWFNEEASIPHGAP